MAEVKAYRRGGKRPGLVRAHVRQYCQGIQPPGRYPAIVVVRVPLGLKEWYERRAAEQGVSTSTLIREILQAKRHVVTGNDTNDDI